MSPVTEEPRHVVIAGAGVSGLALAWRLLADPELGAATPTQPADPTVPSLADRRSRLRVTVLEPKSRTGGNIGCERDDGFLVEWGPNGFLDNAPETPRLVRALGIETRLLRASDAAGRRFLFTRGRLRPVPMSPPAFLLSNLLTLRGRMRVLREPFVPARSDSDETIFGFAARRIGEEAARVLVGAMVAGVYAGDAKALSLRACFPKMYELESRYGGLVRGMIAKRKETRRHAKHDDVQGGAQNAARDGGSTRRGGPAGPGGTLTSFDDGMHVLTDALETAVRTAGGNIQCGSRIESITPPAASGRPWRITANRELSANVVVLAMPAFGAAPLVATFDPGLAEPLRAIPDAPIVVVALAFTEEQLRNAAHTSNAPLPPRATLPPRVLPELDGFGFLIPRGEGPRSLGVLWDSSIYPGRAPHGRVLLRAMLGGALDPMAAEMSDDEVLAAVRADLRLTMGLDVQPSRSWILRHPRGIPQYTVGHLERIATLEAGLHRWPGLFLAGNSYHGISVNHCVERSILVARGVLAQIFAD